MPTPIVIHRRSPPHIQSGAQLKYRESIFLKILTAARAVLEFDVVVA